MLLGGFLTVICVSIWAYLCDYVCRDVVDEMEEDKRMDEVKIEEHPPSWHGLTS